MRSVTWRDALGSSGISRVAAVAACETYRMSVLTSESATVSSASDERATESDGVASRTTRVARQATSVASVSTREDSGASPADSRAPPADSRPPPTDTSAPPSDSRAPPSDSGAPPSDSGALVLAREVDAFVDLGDGAVDDLDGALAVTAFVGDGVVELVAGGAEVVACGNHVVLRGVDASGDEAAGEEDDEGEDREQTVLHDRLLHSVRSREVDAGAHFADRLVDQFERALAVAAFVRVRGLELGARGLEMIQCSLHMRLSAGRASGCVTDHDDENGEKGKDASKLHTSPSFPVSSWSSRAFLRSPRTSAAARVRPERARPRGRRSRISCRAASGGRPPATSPS